MPIYEIFIYQTTMISQASTTVFCLTKPKPGEVTPLRRASGSWKSVISRKMHYESKYQPMIYISREYDQPYYDIFHLRLPDGQDCREKNTGWRIVD